MAVFYAANVFGAGADVSVSRANQTKNVENSEPNRDNDSNASRIARRINSATQTNRQSENTDKSGETRTAVARNITRAISKNSDNSTRVNNQKANVNVVSRSTRKNVSNRSVAESVANVVGRNPRTEAASINSNPAVRRAGVTLRATTAEVGGRAKIAGTDIQTGSNIDEQIHSIRGRASLVSSPKKQIVPTAESIATAKDLLEKTADLNNTCQQQYNECMDQFCAVVDANQKRCSCSENLAKYAKVQQAVENANTELNDVAQNIRYLGLSADEIRAIMNATEAEEALDKNKDTSQTRSMLEDIANMIKDPTSSSSSYYSSNGDSLLDMELDFSSDSSDMFGLELFTSSSNDISSKRGKDLYKEATKRCKTILTQCRDAGATESQITGNYDLAITKDCAAYEQGLEKLNKTLLSNVRSANLMLQKGRLTVLQNKNQYDARGCIGALENCMLDDMVCGEGYVKCLDPTKRYIDENGAVVLGRNIANITAFMENYDNSNINTEFIKSSANDLNCANGDGACIVNYLMNKIGSGQSAKDGGLCRAVLDKCQDYTYLSNGKSSTYVPYNDVVVNYIQRAMVNIKSAQSRIISDYASTCLADISECYNQQITQINALSTTANADSIYSVMTGACYNVALTCGYAVFAYDPDIGALTDTCDNCKHYYNDKCLHDPEQTNCVSYAANTCHVACSGGDTSSNQKLILIRAVSDLFYQSLLCPSNSSFVTSGAQAVSVNRTMEGYANSRCKCDTGYAVWGGACLATCAEDEYRNTLGSCISCEEGTTPTGGTSGRTENNTCQ